MIRESFRVPALHLTRRERPRGYGAEMKIRYRDNNLARGPVFLSIFFCLFCFVFFSFVFFFLSSFLFVFFFFLSRKKKAC